MPNYQTTCVRRIFLSSCLSLFAPPKYPVRYVGILTVQLKIIKNENYVQSEKEIQLLLSLICVLVRISFLPYMLPPSPHSTVKLSAKDMP